MIKTQSVKAGSVTIGGDAPLALIAGPCVIESEELTLKIAEDLKKQTSRFDIGFIFKASFDKANRSSLSSYRGPGLEEGLKILEKVKNELELPVISDIHLPEHAAPAADVLDIMQIPAFLCRQTDLLVAAAVTGKPVNVKKGQFLSPEECSNIINKVRETENGSVCITERGTTFGYNRLLNDFAGIETIREMGAPVIFDATHSVQQPGGLGTTSGGCSANVPTLARAAVAVGIDGLFLETHPDPDHAKSDGPNMLPTSSISDLLTILLKLDAIIR